MNDHFVSIKVDREERPDVDGLYMTAVVSQTGQGGWPMTVFLLPDGAPVLRRHLLPARGARRAAVVPAGARRHRDGLPRAARDRRAAGRARWPRACRRGGSAAARGLRGSREATLLDALLTLRGQHDERNGGFGRAPKFPPHSVLTFLLRMHRRSGSEEALAMAAAHARAHGRRRHPRPARRRLPPLRGRRDLARAALRADALRQRAARARLPRGLAGDGRRALARGRRGHPRLPAARARARARRLRLGAGRRHRRRRGRDVHVDARAAARRALADEDAALAERVWGVTERGQLRGRDRALAWSRRPRTTTSAQRLAAHPRGTLLEARAPRPQPALDDKALASWNGMALAALAEGARLLPAARPAGGGRALRRVPARPALAPGRRPLAHAPRRPQPGAGLPRRLRAGRRRACTSSTSRRASTATSPSRGASRCSPCERFGAPDGAFFDTAHDAEVLVARPRELDDNPTPSGASTLAGLLVRLARTYGEPELERRARAVVDAGRRRCWRARRRASATCSASATRCSSAPREAAVVGAPRRSRARPS